MNYIQIQTEKWLRIAFVNLLIVALLGILMRYKIAYSLPFIDQKNVMNAHSHFAFSAWISQALMVLMVNYLSNHSGETVLKKYYWVLMANLVISYAMLLSFLDRPANLQVVGFGIVDYALSAWLTHIGRLPSWERLVERLPSPIGAFHAGV